MTKLTVFVVLVSCLALIALPIHLGAEGNNQSILIVSHEGDGEWEDGHWTVTLWPGESKSAELVFHNPLDVDLDVTARATPCSLDNGNVVFCFCTRTFTIAAGGNYTDTLVVTADGDTTPGEYSVAIVLETDTPLEPEPEPDPDPDPDPAPEPDITPHRVSLTASASNKTVGELHRVSAVVYNQVDEPIPGISLTWSIPTGDATIVDVAATTNSAGVAWADVRSLVPGSASVRCYAGTTASGTISIAWSAAIVPDPEPPAPSEGGLSKTVIFMIVLLIVGAGVFLYLRWKKRRTEAVEADLDPLESVELP